MKWRKLQEGSRPEYGQKVLVTDGREVVSAVYSKPFCLDDGGIEFTLSPCGWGGYEWDFDLWESDITHWLPIPALPQKEEV